MRPKYLGEPKDDVGMVLIMTSIGAANMGCWYGLYRLFRKVGIRKSLFLLASLATVIVGLAVGITHVFPLIIINMDGPSEEGDKSWRIPQQ